MDIFLKATACVLVAVLLCLVLSSQGKNYTLLLSLAVCAMVFTAAGVYLQPIVSFFSRLVQLGQLNTDLLSLLLKISGIGLISQIACVVCADAGNKALEKTLQMLSAVTILWIAIPLLEEMLQMMESLLEAV